MALHHVHHILHQQIALHLHDGRRRRAHEQHHKIVARLGAVVFLVLIEIGVVKRHLDGGAQLGQLVEAHAHFIERLAKIVVATHRPAHLQHVLLSIELDSRLFFVGTGRAIGQRAGTGVFPQGFERLLELFKAGIGAQLDLSVDMDFKGSVVT